MSIFAIIAGRAAAESLPFLVIGGNAVIAYGYPRQTVDIDLLVKESDRTAWDKVLIDQAYRVHFSQAAFQMYNPPVGTLPPVDLMLVDDATFDKLQMDSREIPMGSVRVRIPSLRHLIALKLHALRSGQAYRRERDFVDVITLVQLNQVDLASPDYSAILDRYATPAVRAELESRLARSQSADA